MRTWQWAPDGARIYFVTPDTIDDDEKTRRDKKFTVNIRNPETPVASLWALDVAAREHEAPHRRRRYSADDFTISKDSKWIGFRGLSPNRYSAASRRRICIPICTCWKRRPDRSSA